MTIEGASLIAGFFMCKSKSLIISFLCFKFDIERKKIIFLGYKK